MPERLLHARPGVSKGIQQGARISQSGRVNHPVLFAACPGVGPWSPASTSLRLSGPLSPPLDNAGGMTWSLKASPPQFASSAPNLSWSESRDRSQCLEEADRAVSGILHFLLKFGNYPREGAENRRHPGQPPRAAECLLCTRPGLSSLHEKPPWTFLQPMCGRG